MSGGPAQRKLILGMSMSLDGFVARRDGVIDWLRRLRRAARAHDDRRHRAELELLGQTGRWCLAAASATPADRA